MANGWGKRIGTGFTVFVLVTVVVIIPAAAIGATISCWGDDPSLYCELGAIWGLLSAPAIGLVASLVYVARDLDRRDRERNQRT